MSIEVSSADIIRIMLQFLKEQNLMRSYESLTQETGVNMNAVDSIEAFRGEIQQGHWDTVLKIVRNLTLPLRKQIILYEQIIIELIEMRELGAARSLLRQTDIMQRCRDLEPDRYMRMETLLAKPYFDPKEAYSGTTRDKQRAVVAQELASEVVVAPPNRLMTLIGQALKWQQSKGLIPHGLDIDIFTGRTNVQEKEDEMYPTKFARAIKMGKDNHAEACCFSNDGQYLATGSHDGLIEIWNFMTGKRRKDLPYQAENDYLAMEPNKDKAEEFNAVCTLTFSNDSDYIAGGDSAGYVKVWRVANKDLRRRLRCGAADSGVTSLQFSRDGARLVSGCFDNVVRIHSLDTGALLKEFRGHTSFVNDVCFSPDNHYVVSASSDGSVRVWNVRTRECTSAITTRASQIPCNRVVINPLNVDQIIICDLSNTITVTTLKGQVVRSYSTSSEKDQFVDIAPSSKCQWLYAVTSDGMLFCFNTATGKVDNKLKVSEEEGKILGLAAHPFKNMVAVYASAGPVTLWEA